MGSIYYKGYTIKELTDGDIGVFKGTKLLQSCVNEYEAREYIEDLPSHDLTRSISQEYCIVLRFPPSNREYYLSNRGRSIPATGAARKDIKLFKSKAEAQKIYYSKIRPAIINKTGVEPWYTIKLYK